MRISRWSTPIALAALLLGSAAMAATAQAAAPGAATPGAVTHVAAHHLPALHLSSHSRLKNVEYSDNWGGYAVTGTTFTSVSTTFTQPKVTCGSATTYSAFWVGLDGYSSSSVEQTGTEADCSGGSASYSAWYEMYPANPVTYSNTVSPGDKITETVTRSGNTYTLKLVDSTAGWTKTTKKTGSHSNSSAEVIVEAPYSGGVLPLAHFAATTFSSITADGSAFSSFTEHQLDITSTGTSSGTLEESTSTMSGSSFTATWHAS